MDAFLNGLQEQADTYWLGCGRCVEFYGLNEAYLPLLDALEQLCRSEQGDLVLSELDRYAPSWLLQLPEFVTDRAALERRVQGSGRERMLREFAQLLEALSQHKMLVLCVEDLHWVDNATLEQLTYLAQRSQTAKLLIIGSYRPVDAYTSNQALIKLLPELTRYLHCNEHALMLLSEAAVSDYVRNHYAGLPDQLARLLQRRSGGNPLFMHNILDYLHVRDWIIEDKGRWQFTGDLDALESELPDAIRLLIQRRLEQLGEKEQELLKAASAAGFNFAAAGLAAGLNTQPDMVERCCEQLVQRAQFLRNSGEEHWPDGTVTARYEFIHALYQETLHKQLTPTQRVKLHQRIGERIEQGYRNNTELVAAQLAQHFERSHDYERALKYFTQAAEHANKVNAFKEAISYIEIALGLLKKLPDDEVNADQEIVLQNMLAGILTGMSFADPRIEKAYLRAQQLCQQWGKRNHDFDISRRIYLYYLVRAEIDTALNVANHCLSMAKESGDQTQLMEAHRAMGNTLGNCGQFSKARHHLECCVSLYDKQKSSFYTIYYGFDSKAVSLSFLSEILWHLGFSQLAIDTSQRALAAAKDLAHPPTKIFVLENVLRLHIRRREVNIALGYANLQLEIANDYGLAYWQLIAKSWICWAFAEKGEVEINMPTLLKILDDSWTTGAMIIFPFLQGLVAELYDRLGQSDKGLKIIQKGVNHVEETGERWHEAELYRLQGELLLSQGKTDAESKAEISFQKSLTVARQQEAKSWELRTATSLARLWHKQGNSRQALDLLTPVYEWFTEGFDTRDLQDAKALLTQLVTASR